MNIHPLRNLEAEEQRAIEELMVEFNDTHRTFNHLVYELEKLEGIMDELENRSRDVTSRKQYLEESGGRALADNLTRTLNHLKHDEESLIRDEEAILRASKKIHHRVAADILKALKRFRAAA